MVRRAPTLILCALALLAIFNIALGLISAVASERLGYTFLLGAFLAGAAMPFDIGLRSNLGEKIRWLTRWYAEEGDGAAQCRGSGEGERASEGSLCAPRGITELRPMP